jgi:16S rRNA (cytosine967-C5)-methyltransferase
LKAKLTTRAVSARILAAVVSGESLVRALPKGLESLSAEDRPLVQELVYGTLREWPRLEGITSQLLRKTPRSKDADILCLIFTGIHQLSALNVPSHAAVGETVEAAKSLGKSWATGLINGCLRNYQRQKDHLEDHLAPHQKHALPEWLWEKICEQWPDQSHEIARASRTHPPMTLRVNLQRVSREDYIAQLLHADIPVTSHPHIATAITLQAPKPVSSIPGFLEGWSSVQDASAQLAAQFLQPTNQESIFDACAAPGGKTCHLLERAPEAHVLAADISSQRLVGVQENSDRLNLPLEVAVLDASQASATLLPKQFDAVLADVPCSATGVIRRNPDIKVTRKAADIERFSQQQREILTGLWPLVKPGGRLLYVTCSLLEAENDEIITAAQSDLPQCEVMPLAGKLGFKTRLGWQTLPSLEDGDGLYFSLLQKMTTNPSV